MTRRHPITGVATVGAVGAHGALVALVALVALAACGPAAPAPQGPPAPAPAGAPAALAGAPAAAPAAAPVVTPPPAPAAPAPPDPTPVVDGDVTVAWMNGMQILVKRVPGAELVAAQLYVRGGVRNWGRDTAGVEQLALSVAAAGGTARMPKDAFVRRLATLGSSIDAQAGNDYSVIAAKSLKARWPETFTLLVDVFLQPALPRDEIELQRQLLLSGLRREREQPDGRVGLRSHKAVYRGHPYEHRAVGTIANVTRFGARDLAGHLARLRETSRLLLVVVGDVDAAAVTASARAALGRLPRGSYREAPLPAVAFAKPQLVPIKEQLPTTYVMSVFPGPRRTDPDYAAAVVAMQILGVREFEEVRTKRSLSYAPAAYLSGREALTLGVLSVSSVDPSAAMKVMFAEARRLKHEPVPAKELSGAKSVYLTGYLMASEGTDGQAALLARAELLAGDWRLARTLPDRVRAVTAAEVQAFARRAITNLQTVVMGGDTFLPRNAP